MSEDKITRDEVIELCACACRTAGLSEEDALITARVLTDTDMLGIHSHGTKNLPRYIEKIEAGGIDPKAVFTVEKEGPSWALADGGAGMGMVIASKGMELAIEKAKQTGIAIVIVKNATHFGAASSYSLQAARAGMFGLAMGNTEPNMTAPGGRGKILGNSPFSYAFPGGEDGPVFLDVALSETAALKVIKAADKGEKIPPTWIVDENGEPTTDPADFYKGALAPMAAHKGYGLSIMVEFLTEILSGGKMLGEISSWLFRLPDPNEVGQAFIAVRLDNFLDQDTYTSRVGQYRSEIKNAPKRAGVEKIYMPGEIELARCAKAEKEGLDLPEDVKAALQELKDRVNSAK